jgi:mRNA interferase MazF
MSVQVCLLNCQLRTSSVERLDKCWGNVSSGTLAEVEDRLKILMGL